jgi:hypothetical protein
MKIDKTPYRERLRFCIGHLPRGIIPLSRCPENQGCLRVVLIVGLAVGMQPFAYTAEIATTNANAAWVSGWIRS